MVKPPLCREYNNTPADRTAREALADDSVDILNKYASGRKIDQKGARPGSEPQLPLHPADYRLSMRLNTITTASAWPAPKPAP